MEIEKKFLLKSMPVNWAFHPHDTMIQGYVSTDPVIRIRKKNDSHILTVKGKGLMVREEFEMPITAAQFKRLMNKVSDNPVNKTRYYIPIGNGLTAELDVFEGLLDGLVMVEVEFDSVEDAEAFTPPSWFGKEVTEDVRYHNSYLCSLESPVDLI